MRWLNRFEEALIAILMGAATLIIFLAVLHRYALGVDWLYPLANRFSTSWAQELCIYLFVWMAKFGAAYGVRTGIHVGVDVLVNRLRPAWRRALILFGLLAGALFTAVIGSLGAMLVWQMKETGQVSADLEVPIWFVYLAIPLGSFLMCFRFLQVAWRFTRTGELPKHDPARVEGLDDLESAKA